MPARQLPGCLAVLLTLGSVGCAGVFGFDATSDSGGWHANGYLRRPAALSKTGDGYVIPGPWSERQSNFGSDELVGAIVRATRAVARAYPGSVAAVGDLSRRGGGGSVEHRSHQSGRDVDIFYYGVNARGRSVVPGNVMLHYERSGRAARWSRSGYARAATSFGRPVRVRRNWQLVARCCGIRGRGARIFVSETWPAGSSARHGGRRRLSAAGRAAQIVRQPSDSEPHDDHITSRVLRPDDRVLGSRTVGCAMVEEAVEYMAPPFGDSGERRRAGDAVAAARQNPVSMGNRA